MGKEPNPAAWPAGSLDGLLHLHPLIAIEPHTPMIRFIIQVACFGLFYILVLVASFPFWTIMGTPKPWQKKLEFMLFFPVDNEKIGVMWLPGMIAVIFLNGVIWGVVLVGLFRIGMYVKSLI